MPEETISIITFEEGTPVTDSSGKPTGSKKGIAREGTEFWGQKDTEEALEPIRLEYLTKSQVPVSKLEAELDSLVGQMKRILGRLEPSAKEGGQIADASPTERGFILSEISIHVEVSAEGGVSILGTGGKLGGKGGMQLTFGRT